MELMRAITQGKAIAAQRSWLASRSTATATLDDYARRAVPCTEWPTLAQSDEATKLARARYWQEQPSGTVELVNLAEQVNLTVGNTDAALIEVVRLGEQGASIAGRLHTWLAPQEAAAILAPRFGLRLPEPGRAGVTVAGLGRRLEDGRVWKRNLVRQHLQACERQRMAEGQVRRGRDAYVSTQTLHCFKQRWRDQREAMDAARAISDAGDELALAELLASSTANPRNRFAELMTRAKGFEQIAEELGHAGVFLTVTCPSRFHASKTFSEKRAKGGRRYWQETNPAWRAAGQPTPQDGNRHLCRVWERTRAAAHRRGLAVYGLRTVEPHADSCPHWHMMLFGEPSSLALYVSLFNHYACQEDAEELAGKVWARKDGRWVKVAGATARFDCKPMDAAVVREDGSRVGGAAAYLCKYLTKNLDGKTWGRTKDGKKTLAALGEDEETGLDTVSGAEAVRAWASLWHTRQFQCFGGVPVGLWRELRRRRGAAHEHALIEQATRAADQGDWRAFVMLLGGPLAVRRDIPLRLRKTVRPELMNRYGESACAVVTGVEAGSAQAITRDKRWRIEWRKPAERMPLPALTRVSSTEPQPVEDGGTWYDSLTWEPVQAGATPWPSRTCVNNCTQPMTQTGFEALSGVDVGEFAPVDEDMPGWLADDGEEAGPPVGRDEGDKDGAGGPWAFDAGYLDALVAGDGR